MVDRISTGVEPSELIFDVLRVDHDREGVPAEEVLDAGRTDLEGLARVVSYEVITCVGCAGSSCSGRTSLRGVRIGRCPSLRSRGLSKDELGGVLVELDWFDGCEERPSLVSGWSSFECDVEDVVGVGEPDSSVSVTVRGVASGGSCR